MQAKIASKDVDGVEAAPVATVFAVLVVAAAALVAVAPAGQVIVVVAGAEAHEHTALADCATAAKDAVGQAVATQGMTADEIWD